MTDRFRASAIPIVLLSFSVVCLAQEQGEKEWTWKDASGQIRTRAELDEIVQQHKLWLESGRKLGARANLSRANLREADLSHADLELADVSGAFLVLANLRYADLTDADLHDAFLSGADLRETFLTNTNMNGAHVGHAFLDPRENMGLFFATGANLSGAKLWRTKLTDATMTEADLWFAQFEPSSNPETREMAAVKHLEFITYDSNPDALVQLRKQFQDGGFREQERKIIYALKRREAEILWQGCRARVNLLDCVGYFFNRVFFDLTCQYGMSPGRPLTLGLVLWFVCSLVYVVAIHYPRRGGLLRIVPQTPTPVVAPGRIRLEPLHASGSLQYMRRFLWRELVVLRTAMFFSLMSAFNIGFRDINFGRWLRLLTLHEYDLKAVGWVRPVAGLQSLLSVGFIALWVLTYFGRPFDY